MTWVRIWIGTHIIPDDFEVYLAAFCGYTGGESSHLPVCLFVRVISITKNIFGKCVCVAGWSRAVRHCCAWCNQGNVLHNIFSSLKFFFTLRRGFAGYRWAGIVTFVCISRPSALLVP